jgi:carbamoyl-phosphate synthase/aspartate carbamoyltransferase/dihydroorotase
MLIEDKPLLEGVFKAWENSKPILVHAEGPQLEMAIDMAKTFSRRLHVCHISQASEVAMVRNAKKSGQPVTAGVCPHHLFMTGEARDTMKGYAMMKPPLGTAKDQEGLWEGINDGSIDLVETDHAPHTREEKEQDKPAFGVPGLETAVGLLGKAIADGKIPESMLQKLLHDSPKKIFNIPDQQDTYVEIDLNKKYVVGPPYESKCGWTPFEGWELAGTIETVQFKGKTLVKNNRII